MKIISFFLILFFFFSPSEITTEKMQWSETRKLNWGDFKGTPNLGDDYVASTNSGISFSYSIGSRNGEFIFDYTVLSNFYPEQSWYKPEAASVYILKHEQTHFDISELHARKLRKKLAAIAVGENIKAEVDQLYSETERERRAMQKAFDKESDHSKIKDGEYKWRNYIATELQNYDGWK